MKKIPDKIYNDHFKTMALMMAIHCVRRTIIEDYHVAGKISDEEMMKFNKEVSNKIYTFLQVMFNPSNRKQRKQLISILNEWGTDGWDQPRLDESLLKVLNLNESELD
ncbi:MAG TPA: hypothetical protein VF974_08680 [Patescibacteria group bacterium]